MKFHLAASNFKMAAPMTNFAAKQSMRALHPERWPIGCFLVRQPPARTTRACSILYARTPVKDSNHSINYGQHATRSLSTTRAVSCANQDCTLEDFSEELNVMEKPKRYKAWAPADDVYMIAHYPPKQVPFKEAIEQLRTQARWHHLPECPYKNRRVELSIHLNMNTGKKPMAAFSGMFLPPHNYQGTNKVICLAEGEEAKKAEEAGANLVIGTDNFPDIESGEVLISDYDFCVASKAILPHLPKIKTFIRDKYPSTKKGSAGENIEEIIQRHRYGKIYRVVESGNMISHCPIGELGLSDEQIEDNIKFLLNEVLKRRPSPHEPFITRVSLKGLRLSSHRLQFQDYLPEVTEKMEEVDQRSELERIEDELRELRAS